MATTKTERPGRDKPAKSPGREHDPAKTKPKPPKTVQTVEAVDTVEEIGGRDGPDPTRYGDYEKDGRCVDF